MSAVWIIWMRNKKDTLPSAEATKYLKIRYLLAKFA